MENFPVMFILKTKYFWKKNHIRIEFLFVSSLNIYLEIMNTLKTNVFVFILMSIEFKFFIHI